MAVQLPVSPLPGADQSGSLAEAQQANNDTLATSIQDVPRIVRGVVNADGTLSTGTGFTSVKNVVGDYSVTFTPPFSTTPTVLPVGVGRDLSLKAAPSTTGFGVTTYTSAGAAIDAQWTFVAIGT